MNKKEAIEIIKKNWPDSCYTMLQEALQTLIPELKESEDERIKKDIIKYLEQSQFGEEHYQIDDDVVRNYIAWLEKQGTQKQVSIWKHWEDGIMGNGEGEPIFLIKIGNMYRISSCLSCECDYIKLSELDNLLLEKQGDKSDYNPYKTTVESISAMVERYDPFNSNLQDFYDNVKVKCKDAMEYEKTFLEKQNEQKSAWGEENEEMIDAIIADIKFTQKAHNHEVNQIVYEREIDWLKSLKERIKL